MTTDSSLTTPLLLLSAAIVSFNAVAEELPPGVPNPLGPDGKHTSAIFFTTRAYQAEAFKLVLKEANRVVGELQLPEKLPITDSDIVRAFISPFGDAHVNKRLGNITTQNYTYGVEEGNKFTDLCIADLDRHCFEYQEKGRLPTKEVDTNEAYRLATQWLAAVSVDVEALNRECQVHVAPNAFWNRIKPGAKLRTKTFVPIYDVNWMFPTNETKKIGPAAYVQLFTPTKTLLQLTIEEPKYILRPPLVVTNLAYLLSQTNSPPK